jgi:hypothetical protein
MRIVTATIALGIACSLRPAVAAAQSRSAADYVLLATDVLSVDRFTVTDGEIGVLRGPHGAWHARALGRAMSLDMPHAGTLDVTIGFADPAGNQCAVMTGPLRPARTGGLRSP